MVKSVVCHEPSRLKTAEGRFKFQGLCTRITVTAAVILAVTLLAGQAYAKEIEKAVHPDLKAEIAESPRLGLVQPNIDIYQVSTGGVSERMQDWCDVACGNVSGAIGEHFGGEIKIIPEDVFDEGSSLGEEMQEVEALYRTVTVTMARTWRGAAPFPKEYRKFDYSLGDLSELFDALDVDALIFVEGYDQVKTGGRKAFEVVGFLVGGYVFSKTAYVDVGLVARSGKLVWYRMIGSLPKTDFREAEGAKAYVEKVFEGFPVK